MNRLAQWLRRLANPARAGARDGYRDMIRYARRP